MRVKLFVFTLVLCFIFSYLITETSAQNLISRVNKGKIKIDGLSDDWMGIDAVIEEVGLPSTGAFGSFDVKKLFLTSDGDNLYFCCQ